VLSLGVNEAPMKNDAGHINQKINNVIRKVEAIQKDLDAGNNISRDEAIHFNRRLGPYYRELNSIRLLLETQPHSPLRTKVDSLGRTLNKVKREIEMKRMPQATTT
jgi:hypothetical protein